jgi:pyruvate dehydrogenase phosphatase
MWAQRFFQQAPRRAAARSRFSTRGTKSGSLGRASLTASALFAGSVAALLYRKLSEGGETARVATASLREVHGTTVPHLKSLGHSDGIEYAPVITAEDVDTMLSKDAYRCCDGVVRGVEKYEGAQLGSNAVCEDAYIHGKIPSPLKTDHDEEWMVWGVFDGHNGWQTSSLLTKQLLPYVQRALQNIGLQDGAVADNAIHKAIRLAFKTLDDDLVGTAKDIIESDLPYPDKVKRLEPAQSGACALLTLYDPSRRKLHVASTGDCRAVIGHKTQQGKWMATVLTRDQTGSNEEEIARLREQFPNEPDISRSRGRVYGMQPSRTFGDGVYKWNGELREKLRVQYNAFKQPGVDWFPSMGDGPYLTALPIVSTVQLPEDGSPCFLIQATDGLWDTMGNQNAVDLVGRWSEMPTATTPGPKEKSCLPYVEPVKFGRSRCWYSESRAAYLDSNAAIHLIRNGLGGSHDEMVRGALSFTPPLSRWIRDDITVQVIFFEGKNK